MTDVSDAPSEDEEWHIDSLPDVIASGTSVLVASAGDPGQYATCLRILCQYGGADDTAIVVTTTESAEGTIDAYERLCPDPNRPTLSLVDTTSEQQSVSAPYNQTSVVYTPDPGDLERLVMALSDLSGRGAPSQNARHLVIRSLTPILQSTTPSRVRSILERITGLRSEDGLCLLGVDYTAHDQTAIQTLTDQVDGILWVTRPRSDRLAFEYRPASGRVIRAVTDTETDG